EAAPGGDLQVDAVEHGSGADTAAEAFVDIAHGEHGYRGDGVDGAKGGCLGHGVSSSSAVGSPSVGRAVTDRADSTSLRAESLVGMVSTSRAEPVSTDSPSRMSTRP